MDDGAAKSDAFKNCLCEETFKGGGVATVAERLRSFR